MNNNYKNLKSGDLVCYKHNKDLGLYNNTRIKIGTVLEINPTLGSGFQTAEIFWADEETKETVVINYLYLIND